MTSQVGGDVAWLDRAAADFEGFVGRLAAPGHRWGVPVTQLWYVDGSTYLGTVVIRRELTPELARVGGHIGYHVVPSNRRRGHAGRMLGDALVFCAHFGLRRVLLTLPADQRGVPQGERSQRWAARRHRRRRASLLDPHPADR
jgi:predicted acetyltransferase